MTNSTLKATAAVIALTAGSAWAGSDVDADAKTKAGYDEEQSAQTAPATETESTTAEAADTTGPASGDEETTSNNALTAEDSAIPAIDEAEVDTTSPEEDTDVAESSSDTTDETATAENEADDAPVSISEMTVAELVGMDVETVNGEDLGEVDYVIKEGDEVHAILGVGGFLGLGEHDVAVPLTDLSLSDDNTLQLANWSKDKLESEPDVDESTIEAMDDDQRIGALS